LGDVYFMDFDKFAWYNMDNSVLRGKIMLNKPTTKRKNLVAVLTLLIEVASNCSLHKLCCRGEHCSPDFGSTLFTPTTSH